MTSKLAKPVGLKWNGIASLDNTLNRQIVKMLQNDGRRPYKDIATALDVSEGTVRNRVQSMKQAGALRIVALVDPTEVRYETDAMIGIKVTPGYSVAQVSQRLGESPDVVYILWVTGRYDLYRRHQQSPRFPRIPGKGNSHPTRHRVERNHVGTEKFQEPVPAQV